MPKFCKVAVSVMPRVATSDTCVVMRMPPTEDGLLPGVRLSSCEQLDIRRRAQAIWGNKLDNFIFISFIQVSQVQKLKELKELSLPMVAEELRQ